MNLLIGLLWLVSSVCAQESGLQSYYIPDHTGGLYSYLSSQRLEKSQATDIINGFLDKDKGVVKRNGQSQYGTISGCSSQIRAGVAYKTSGGADYVFNTCGTQNYLTTGDGTYSVHGATINATARVRFSAALGKLWQVDGVDPTWYTDGVTVSSPSQAVASSLIGSYKSRIVLANWAGNRSSVLLGGFSSLTDFALPSVIVDTSPVVFYLNGPNDGRGVTCMFDGYKDVLILFNEDQMFGLYGNGYNTFVLRKLAEVGCVEQESMREFEGRLKWLSKYGVYEYNGTNASRISDPIKDLITNVINTDSSVQSLTQTLQADWTAGQLDVSGPGALMSATISAGNVVPTTFSVISNTTGTILSGATTIQVSTSDVSGKITLSSYTLSDNFGDGNCTSGLAWTTSAGSLNCSATSNRLEQIVTPAYYQGTSVTPVVASTGSWTFDVAFDGGDLSAEYRFGFLSSTNQRGTTNGYELFINQRDRFVSSGEFQLMKIAGGTETLLSSAAYSGSSFSGTINITRTKLGAITISATSVVTPSAQPNITISATDTSYSNGSYIYVEEYKSAYEETSFYTDNIYYYRYLDTGSVTSQAYYTGLSTPVWGLFSSTNTSYSDAQIAFYTQVSADGASWDARVASSDTIVVTSLAKPYIRSVAEFSTQISTKTPTLSSISLSAATTGYFITNCFSVGAINSWDLFQANSVSNGGSLTFAISTGTSCNAATRSTNTWTTQSNNASITIATAAFIASRVLFNLTQASQAPTLQDITIGYRLGAGRPPVASIIYDNRYWLSFSTNTSGTAYNDTVLVYDKNSNWTKLKGINASSLWLSKRILYSGSALSDGKIIVQDSGSTDLGNNIYFRFKTPDYDMDSMSSKSLYDLTAEFLPTNNSVQGTTVTVNYYADKSTTAYALGGFYTYKPTNGILYDTMRFGQTNAPILVKTISFEYTNDSVNPITLYRSLVRFMLLDFW